MPSISATTRPILWTAVRSGDVIATGITQVGETTASAELTSAEDEQTLLAAVVDAQLDTPPLPAVGEPVEAGQIYDHAGTLVWCWQSHTRTQFDPSLTPNLFLIYSPDADGAPEWVSLSYAYKGARRMYEGVLYEAIQDPGVNLFPPPQVPAVWVVVSLTDEWQAGVAYSVNDEVTYQGVTYRCLQAHTSISTWYPSAVGIINVLWQAI